MASADALLVEQALGNVVSNAVAHTPAGTRIVIDAQLSPDVIALRVTNDGPGIPADILPRVFEKFVRSHRTHPAGFDRGRRLVLTRR